jgi:hypothetical protein
LFDRFITSANASQQSQSASGATTRSISLSGDSSQTQSVLAALARSRSFDSSSSQAQQFIAELTWTRYFTLSASQSQSHSGIAIALSGEPSIYIAYVPIYDQTSYVTDSSYSALVPPEPDAAIVPPIDYEITV